VPVRAKLKISGYDASPETSPKAPGPGTTVEANRAKLNVRNGGGNSLGKYPIPRSFLMVKLMPPVSVEMPCEGSIGEGGWRAGG
jgi:hypothetical protein